jgi:GntR family galactonate operon transcriptional repressor
MKTKISRSLPTQIVIELGSKIVHGDIEPGTILTSDSLEQKYGVSRTVIREALKVLHDKGLTRARTKTGTIVLERAEWDLLDEDVLNWLQISGLSVELITDLEELRSTYEPGVARVAAKRRGSRDIAQLKSSLKKMTDAFYAEGPNSALIAQADVEFHEALQVATQNDLIKKMGKLILPLLKIRDDLVGHAIVEADFIIQHQAILDAVIDEDPDSAELAMKVLLETAAQTSSVIRKNEK